MRDEACRGSAITFTIEKLVDQVQSALRQIKTKEDAGGPLGLDDLLSSVKDSLSVDGKELLLLLEKYGYIIVDRPNNLVGLSADGAKVVRGNLRIELTGDLVAQYSDRLAGVEKKPARKYEVLDQRFKRFSIIGAGSVATVYRGQQVSTQREVAIKEFKEIFTYFNDLQKQEITERLERAVSEHARVVHPNVIQIIDQNARRDCPYLVMEVAAGGSLRRLIKRLIPIPTDLLCTYFIQICHGLKSAHALDCVHRGIKPENILFDVHGNVKVSDLGISRVVDRGPGKTGQIFVSMGSVGYMAPEQFQDPRFADTRTDIYSLGILFYEMCTGRLPGRRSPMPSEIREDFPRGLDDIFDRMTQDDPDERYPLIEAILDDLYNVDEIWKQIDKRGAILMHRGPFKDLDLPPLEAASEEIADPVAPVKERARTSTPARAAQPRATGAGSTDAARSGVEKAGPPVIKEIVPQSTARTGAPRRALADLSAIPDADDEDEGEGSGDRTTVGPVEGSEEAFQAEGPPTMTTSVPDDVVIDDDITQDPHPVEAHPSSLGPEIFDGLDDSSGAGGAVETGKPDFDIGEDLVLTRQQEQEESSPTGSQPESGGHAPYGNSKKSDEPLLPKRRFGAPPRRK